MSCLECKPLNWLTAEDERADLRWARGFIASRAEPGTKRLEIVLALLARLGEEPDRADHADHMDDYAEACRQAEKVRE